MFSKIPHIPIKTTRAVPPALKNGSDIPVFGIVFVTTPILIATWTITNVVIPVAIKLPNISGAFIAINIPLQINIANNINTTIQPTNPSSSAITENMKSLCGSGKYKYFALQT